jgi:hypothetical protein
MILSIVMPPSCWETHLPFKHQTRTLQASNSAVPVELHCVGPFLGFYIEIERSAGIVGRLARRATYGRSVSKVPLNPQTSKRSVPGFLQERLPFLAVVEQARDGRLKALLHLAADDPSPVFVLYQTHANVHRLSTTEGYHQWHDKRLISRLF